MQPSSRPVIVARAAGPISTSLAVDPDKSITHRALFFGALNHGVTTIRRPSPAADPRSTLNLLRALGYEIDEDAALWRIHGSFRPEEHDRLLLDCGNSGTTARLAAGFLTGERGRFVLSGDESLARRPMDRVAAPLRRLGADVETSDGRMPVTIVGNGSVPGLAHEELAVTSAQVHGALVLAALRSEQGAIIRREKPMRDHTLRIARRFGVQVHEIEEHGVRVDHIPPSWIDSSVAVSVPGDISSAAFLIAAALLVPGSRLRIQDVGLNPTRTAFLACLRDMEANVQWKVLQDDFEPVGRIDAEYSPDMRGIEIGGEHPDISVAEMMDELPLLALVASQAHGPTRITGAAELRVKESDRLAATRRVLASLGIAMTELEDGFEIGGPQKIAGGTTVDHHGDHRLCMMAAVAGLAAAGPVTIPGPDAALVSYPDFWLHLEKVASWKR